MEPDQISSRMRSALLILNCAMLSIGNCGGPLMMRLYFVGGGKRIWLSSWVASAGFPLILLPLCIVRRTNKDSAAKFFTIKPFLFTASALVGVLTGLDNYLYAYGVERLPASTSSLILATQLVFTAVFAFLLVRQRFTPFSINAVVLLTVGAVVLAVHASGDRPADESDKQYYLGFVVTVAAAALYGFILPLVELIYKKAKQLITYSLVMEVQLVMGLFGTVFCTVGMLVNNDFKVISREASEFDLGEGRYFVVLAWSAIIWQLFFLGAMGVVFCASSFLSGVLIAVLLPATEVLAVIFFKEKFQVEKGIALALSLWGFVSFFYGEIRQAKKRNNTVEAEMDEVVTAQ